MAERVSFGSTRLADGTVRDYEPGDEELVEAGLAVWVSAPVHTPAAGRRLDGIQGRAEVPVEEPAEAVEEPASSSRRRTRTAEVETTDAAPAVEVAAEIR